MKPQLAGFPAYQKGKPASWIIVIQGQAWKDGYNPRVTDENRLHEEVESFQVGLGSHTTMTTINSESNEEHLSVLAPFLVK